MFSGPKSGSGTTNTNANTKNLPLRVRKTIQSIKEIVGNHSDDDIYVMLKETNMDPNETAQKLLNQDPFHEVKRRRERRKENIDTKVSMEAKTALEHATPVGQPRPSWDRYSRKGSYARPSVPGMTQEFRVVRDNRVNQNKEAKAAQLQLLPNNNETGSRSTKESSPGILTDDKNSRSNGNSGSHMPSQDSQRAANAVSAHVRGNDPSGKVQSSSNVNQGASTSNLSSRAQGHFLRRQQHSDSMMPGTSVSGVYSSSTDPVHVPSRNPRASGAVGTIKREVGVVGVRQSSESTTKQSSDPSNLNSVSHVAKESGTSSGNTTSGAKPDHLAQSSRQDHVPSIIPVTRSILGNHHSSRSNQQLPSHQKAVATNMEWKPKSTVPKSGISNTEHSGVALLHVSAANGTSLSAEEDASNLSEKLSHANAGKHQHVIIPDHLRVPEADLTRLSFGSFAAGFDPSKTVAPGFRELSPHLESRSSSESDNLAEVTETVSVDHVVLQDDQPGVSGSNSPSSAVSDERQLPNGKESPVSENLENYASIGLVRAENATTYVHVEPQEQDPSHLQSFVQQAYENPNGYEAHFFRHAMDDNMRDQGIASPHEVLNSYMNGVSPSISLMQQQPVAPIYTQPAGVMPQFSNFLPYRQFVPPVFVPPIAMQNFSGAPGYPHPSTASSYLIMQGGGSHLAPGGVKYPLSQYKTVPPVSPVGFGNYANPAGYAVTTAMIPNATAGSDDASRVKYKDNNLYIPNPQAESSEIWLQTQRELSSLQSSAYYNLPGQVPHAGYMPSHSGHPSFNPAQSPHLPFAGVYHHPSQPAAMANAHHLVHQQLPGIGGVATAPGAQVGSYQQPQMNPMNWTNNF